LKYQTLYKKVLSLDELYSFSKELLKTLPSSAIVILEGDLAAGKTTLVQSFVKELGLDSASSPTFSLQQIYDDRVFHYDFYRVDFNEILELGLIDEFEKEGLHFIEWANSELEKLLYDAGFNIYKIKITPKNKQREYELKVADA